MIRLYPGTHPDLLRKGISNFPSLEVLSQSKGAVHLPNNKCNMKRYLVPSGVILQRFCFRRYATAESLDTSEKDQFFSTVGGSDDSQRRRPLDDDLKVMLEELFSEIKSMIRMGNKNDALDLLEANYEAVKQQMDAGGRGVEEAAILDVIALGYMAIGDFRMVEPILNKLDGIVYDFGDDEPLLESILTHMGSMHLALGKLDNSMRLYKRVIQILEENYGSNSTSLVTPLLGLGKGLSTAGRATKAVNVYHRAISILESDRGAESKELVIPLKALGDLLLEEGKAEDAESPFMRILDICTKLYGKDDKRVGVAMCSLANAKHAKGDVEEAIRLYRNALRVLKDSKNMKLDDGLLEQIRIDLAELLHLVGREKEGRDLLEECLFNAVKYKGKEDPSLVTHLTNLATSYSRSKNYVEAERLLRTSLQITKKNIGRDDPSITFPMLQLAVTLYNLKQDEEAEQLALEVLRIREKAFGTTSLPVGEALDCLICIQNRLERDDERILKLLKRTLSIQEKAFGHDSLEVVETLKKIVFYLDKLGMKDEKYPLEKRLSLLRNKYEQQAWY